MGKLITIFLLLAFNAFFVAAEFSLVRARRTRLEAMGRRGDVLAKFAIRAVDNLTLVLSASQLGITLASLGLGWVAEDILGQAFAVWLSQFPVPIEAGLRGSIAIGAGLGVATYMHIVLGELLPRAVALNHAEDFAKWLAVPLFGFIWITRPLIFVFEKSARILLKITGQENRGMQETVHEADEIRLIVEQSHEEGKIEQEDADLLDAVFEFTEKKARDVMTPRTQMVGLPATASLDEVVAVVQDTAFSRYPVHEETLDDVIGVVLAKDLLPELRQRDVAFDLKRVMRSVLFVPGSREVEEVLTDFKRQKAHMAIVLDEFGGTAGLVTMEDLLEELVGEILDEHDEALVVARLTADETIVDGATPVEDINERMELDVPQEEYATIGGFVFGVLGRLPVTGDRVTAGGALFTVHAMEGRRVSEIAIKKPEN